MCSISLVNHRSALETYHDSSPRGARWANADVARDLPVDAFDLAKQRVRRDPEEARAHVDEPAQERPPEARRHRHLPHGDVALWTDEVAQRVRKAHVQRH